MQTIASALYDAPGGRSACRCARVLRLPGRYCSGSATRACAGPPVAGLAVLVPL